MPRRADFPMVSAPVVDTPPDADEMTSEQAARALGQTNSGVRKAIQTGALPAVLRPMAGRPGRLVYWVKADDVARRRAYLDLRPHPVGGDRREPGRW